MNRLIPFILASILLYLPLNASDYVVIANQSVAQAAISSADLRNIYLGKKSRWDNQGIISPTKLRKGEVDRSFLTDIVRKTPTQFRIFWKRAIFTGTRVPYHTAESEQAVIDYVASTEGAIGYISKDLSKQLPSSVRILNTN